MVAMKLAALALLLLVFQEKNEAEELFKKAEEKLAKAKSVQVKARSAGPSPGTRHSAPISGPVSVAAMKRKASVISVAVVPRAPNATISSDASV